MGFLSQSRHPCLESTNNELSKARLTFRPQCFSHSRRFTPPGNLQIYFVLLPRAGFAFQGFSPLPSCTASSTATPLMTLSNALLLPELPRTVQILLPRLQGLVPSSGPLPPTGGLVLPTPRSPLKFSLLRAFLRAPWRHPRASSTHDLSRRVLTVISPFGLQCFTSTQPAFSISRSASRSSFSTCLDCHRSNNFQPTSKKLEHPRLRA
jgi:hypothetical protein